MEDKIDMATYAELRETRKEKLATKYNELLANKDKAGAWKVLYDIMKYRLIEENLALDEIKKSFKKDERGEILSGDWRFNGAKDRLPENLLADMPTKNVEISILSLAHWIIRRELQYVGDQFAPDKIVKFVVGRCFTYPSVNGSWKSMLDIYKANTGKELNAPWKDMFGTGQAVMYDVSLANGQQYVIKHLGNVVVIPRGKSSARVYILMDIVNMLEQNIDVIDSYTTVRRTIEALLLQCGLMDVEVKDMLDYTGAGEKQRAERKPPMSQDELLEMREQEFDRKKASDIAFRTHRNEDEVYEEVRAERAKAKAEADSKE